MRNEEVCQLYDVTYAAAYDANYLLGKNFIEATQYELSVVSGLLRTARNWLDVACGTGYFLSRFPQRERAGTDISLAMLQIARQANPGVQIFESDFRQPRNEFENRWDLVSCMWFAYCYADSCREIDQVIENLASWTSPDGTCFLPVCDADVLCKIRIPYEPPPDSDDGYLRIAGIIWDWIDKPSGKQHINLIAPHIEHIIEQFSRWFKDVQLLRYPAFQDDCLAGRKAIIAQKALTAHRA